MASPIRRRCCTPPRTTRRSSILLAGLFVISGGILLRGDLVATPLTNTGFLALGGLLASLIGTTGASMLLVRPLLQTNSERTRVKHTVVFFIFVVSNVGGMLTPLGDPPLFLGYLAGVPFTWTLRLLPALGADARHAPRRLLRLRLRAVRARAAAGDRARPRRGPSRSACTAPSTALWLAGVVLAVALLGAPWRELAIVALAAVSLWLTPRSASGAPTTSRAGPIVEVAVLFAGIFVTMLPALDLLAAARRRARRARAVAVLLGDGRALVVPRQRADLSHVPGPRPGAGLAPEVVGRARRHPGRHQRGRGGDGREHLHRQRAQLHGEGDRRGGGASRCRASSATCSTAAPSCCRCSPPSPLIFFR